MKIFFKIIWALFFTWGIGFAGLVWYAILADEGSEWTAVILLFSMFLFWVFIMNKMFSAKQKNIEEEL